MIQNGQKVRIHYKGMLEDGTVFDTSYGLKPLEFVMGGYTVITGVEEAIATMEVGQKITAVIPPEKAYGFYDENRIETTPIWSLPDPGKRYVGETFYLYTLDGLPAPAKLLEIDDSGMAHVDLNQPLAGKTLTFEIELLEVL